MDRKKKHPKCIYCDKSSHVINYGKRGDSVRYLCKKCNKSFTRKYVNNTLSERRAFNQYLDGNPIRKIATQYGVSPMTVFRRYRSLAKKIPQNGHITHKYCSDTKFGGFLVFDGKYIKIKGYSKEIPLLWGIDFQTHDIPHFVLAPAESYHACTSYFSYLRSLNYDMRYLVCDDNTAMKRAAKDVYPKVIIQTCLTHYKESIRRNLSIRTSEKYRPFYYELETIFKERFSVAELSWHVAKLYSAYRSNSHCVYWLEDIMRRQKELTGYHFFKQTPNTTNLIEVYNSHLQARLKSIKGFESYHHAKTWLNAYIVRRRLTPLTGCNVKFKYLNGYCSLERTIKDGLEIPEFFGHGQLNP